MLVVAVRSANNGFWYLRVVQDGTPTVFVIMITFWVGQEEMKINKY